MVLFLISTSTGAAISRATLVAYLFASNVVAVSVSSITHLVTTELLMRTLSFLPLLFLGIFLGHCWYIRADKKTFKTFTLLLLVTLCLLGIGKMVFSQD